MGASSPPVRSAIGIVRVSQVNGRDGESFASPGEQRNRIADGARGTACGLLDTIDELDVSGGTPLAERAGLRSAVEAIEAHQAVGARRRALRSPRPLAASAGRGRFSRRGRRRSRRRARLRRSHERHRRAVAQWHDGRRRERVLPPIDQGAQCRGAGTSRRARSLPWPNVPAGYVRGDDGVLVLGPDAEAVRHAFSLRADGATIQAVREHLRCPRRPSRVLEGHDHARQPRYRGEIHFGQLVNLAAHEPLIDAETFARAQRAKPSRGRRANSERLLARLGVLRCGTCGSRMVVGTSHHGQLLDLPLPADRRLHASRDDQRRDRRVRRRRRRPRRPRGRRGPRLRRGERP